MSEFICEIIEKRIYELFIQINKHKREYEKHKLHKYKDDNFTQIIKNEYLHKSLDLDEWKNMYKEWKCFPPLDENSKDKET